MGVTEGSAILDRLDDVKNLLLAATTCKAQTMIPQSEHLRLGDGTCAFHISCISG